MSEEVGSEGREISESPMSDGGELATSRRRRRRMLANFYGISSEKKQSAGSLSLDSPQFDAEAYLEHVFKTRHIEELVPQSNALVQEVKALDSDLQSLVYENYNKFIRATETIKTMKVNVEDMEEEMVRLEEKMKGISSCCESINASLGERRTRIERLTRVNNVLKKVEYPPSTMIMYTFSCLNRLHGALIQCVSSSSWTCCSFNSFWTYHRHFRDA
jgi:vacuolar protein sorting-associated protein 51